LSAGTQIGAGRRMKTYAASLTVVILLTVIKAQSFDVPEQIKRQISASER
jgi:hypothetical protein